MIATVPLYLGYLAVQPSREAVVPAGVRQLALVEAGPGGGGGIVAVPAAEAREQGAGRRWPLVRRTLFFCAGFSTLFVVVGALVIVLGRELTQWIPWMYYVGAVLTILAGVAMLGWLVRPLNGISERLKTLPFLRSPKGAFTLGMAVAVAWIPCVGPIMAVVAGASGLFAQIGKGLIFLVLFCVGLALPFLAAAYFGEALLARMRRLGRFVTWAMAVTGVLMIVIGGLLLSHDGYEAVEHRVEEVYEKTVPALFEWRDEAEYEEWWEGWFSGEHEEEGEHGAEEGGH
ncbi:cytochrome c biogenesis CcdA family protein [Streptomyces albogriseolus]|uniref:cytochrome c biogenesis CcdA family protein n=1 Tax=Streptomyces albogriseolus TaxID=1887 RepID=UPI00345F245A